MKNLPNLARNESIRENMLKIDAAIRESLVSCGDGGIVTSTDDAVDHISSCAAANHRAKKVN